MDFDLSDEQRLLKDSVERLLEDQYGFEARGKHASGENGFSEDMWQRYAELGLLALPFAEEHGGFGGGPVETMIVMEAFGRALILEPFFATVILAGGVLRHAASDALKAELIPAIAEGRARLAFACAEPQGRYDLFDVETTARKDGDGWVIDGTKGLVLHGDSADRIVLSARTKRGFARRGRHFALYRRCRCRRPVAARLPDAGRAAGGGSHAGQGQGRAGCADRRGGQGLASDLARR